MRTLAIPLLVIAAFAALSVAFGVLPVGIETSWEGFVTWFFAGLLILLCLALAPFVGREG